MKIQSQGSILENTTKIMSAKELLIYGIISLILYVFAIEYLIEVPIIGFFVAWVGWLVPLAFFHGAWAEGNKK